MTNYPTLIISEITLLNKRIEYDVRYPLRGRMNGKNLMIEQDPKRDTSYSKDEGFRPPPNGRIEIRLWEEGDF